MNMEMQLSRRGSFVLRIAYYKKGGSRAESFEEVLVDRDHEVRIETYVANKVKSRKKKLPKGCNGFDLAEKLYKEPPKVSE